jgi:hypothetical protein
MGCSPQTLSAAHYRDVFPLSRVRGATQMMLAKRSGCSSFATSTRFARARVLKKICSAKSFSGLA